jgi:hypothetical protein
MKPIKKIEETRSNRLTLGLHADMQSRLYALISKMPPEKILLEADDLIAWKKVIDIEQDLARVVSDSETTIRLRKKHYERGKVITSLFSEIRSARLSPIKERAEAGQRLFPIVKAYKGLQYENISEQTSHIDGLVVDLMKPEPFGDASTIGVNTHIVMLENLNQEFKTIRVERANTIASDNLPNSKTIRKQADDFTNSILTHIETAYIVASDADRNIISTLIDNINQAIYETATIYKQGASQRKNARDKKKEEEKKKGEKKNEKDNKDTDPDKTPKPGREEDPGEDKA